MHALALTAGEQAAALRYGLAAAERATTTLAFERAAELYARCLELGVESERRSELLRKLATALGCAGRGTRAADAYLEASRLTSGQDAIELLRLACSHLLRTGRFEQGEALLQQVLEAVGVKVPSTPAGLVRAIAFERARAALRGDGYVARDEAEVPPTLLARVDMFESIRYATLQFDPLRSTFFLAQQRRDALRAGEPMRVLQALGGECVLHASLGSARDERRVDTLISECTTLAQKLGTTAAHAYNFATQAGSYWLLGRSQAVLSPAYEAERLYRTL